jgi:N-glycosylase/DNA lyase
VKARRLFLKDGKISIRPLLKRFADIHEGREWLVKNLTGLGYKEASHFLRNVGLGENIAILDRHILRNLSILGVIEEIPESLNRTKYLRIENDMWDFAKRIGIPLSHLDLLLWYKETGEIFK